MKQRVERPYWLDGGSEICFACSFPYVLEMECRCVACDRGVCCSCVVTVHDTREAFCPECFDEERS